MNRITLMAVVLSALVGCGKQTKKDEVNTFDASQFPNVTNSVYGKWHSSVTTNDSLGVPHSFNFYFNSDQQIGYEEVCGTVPNTLTASLTVTGTISNTQITVDTTQDITQKGTGVVATCELQIAPKTFNYSVDDDQLTITDGTTPTTFTRMLP